MTDKEKFLKLLGIASKARKLILGTDAVLENIKSKKIDLVIIASDASEKTKEKIKYVCTNNGISVIEFSTIEELSLEVGKKNKAVIGIKDENFSKRVNRKI